MRVIKIFGFVGAGVLVTLATAVGGALWWVQHSDMRGIASWVVKKQGYDVAFDGPVTVNIWPKGSVNLGKMVVMGGDRKPMFATDEAHVAWSWGGGLTPWNGVQVTRVAASNPVITLVRGKDGVANWESYMTKDEQAKKVSATSSNVASLPLGMLAATQVDIVNLNATYRDAVSGRNVEAKDVNLNATTEGTEAITTLSGMVNGQKISGNLKVDVKDLTDVPLVAKLEAAGLKVAMDGRVHEQKSFAGLIDAQTDNLKTTLASLLGKAPEQVPAAAFRLGGDVDVGAEKISLRNFSTHVGELLEANGDALVHMGAKPSASGTIRVQGSNLRQLAELALMAPQPTIPATSFSVSTKLAGQDAIELQDLQANVGTLLMAAGQVKIVPQSGGQPDIDAHLAVNAPNMSNLMKAMGQKALVPATALKVQGAIKGRAGVYDINGLNAVLDDVATMTGDMHVVVTDQTDVKGNLAIEGSNIKSSAAAFGVASDALPTSPFSVKASITGKGTFRADDVVINLPQLLEATGKVSITPGKPLNIIANMNISRLNLDAMGYCPVTVSNQTGAPTADAPVSNANVAPWTDQPINVGSLQRIAFDVTLDAKGIACERFPVVSLDGQLTNTPSQLDIHDVNARMKDGGSAKLVGKMEHAGTPVLQLTLTTSELNVESLLPVLATKGVHLPVDTNATLTSRGNTTRELAQNLDGTVSMSADGGTLPYTNLLGSASNLATLLQGSSSTTPNNGNGQLDSMKARYTLRQGVATTDELTVSTGNGAMTLKGEGTVDLPNWVIDYRLTPNVSAGSNAIAVPVVIKGPLTAPKIGADPAFVSKFSTRLGGEVLKGVLGKDAGKAVGGALGDVINGHGISKEGIGNLLNQLGSKKATVSETSVSSTTTKPTLQDVFKAF